MDQKPLLDYPTKDLLEKFGKGSHKPGSGSAAAFQGMLAGQMIQTVIGLTTSDKHKARYEAVLPELLRIEGEVTKRVYPTLEKLFQKDASLFDEVIRLRELRDEEKDPERKRVFKSQALEALKPATDILVEIADLNADLADYAAYIFDNAFKPARGDSGVALNGAVAALGGCLSIIDLNLSAFGYDTWASEAREEVERLRTDYHKLSTEARNRMEGFTMTSLKKSFELTKTDLCSGRWEGIRLTDAAIELIADQATSLLWDFRTIVWEKNVPKGRLDVMKPEVIIEKVLDYKFEYADLGYSEDGATEFQVAGLISKKDKQVRISKSLNPEVRNFTSAHELGHALLHSGLETLHRDRPLDGSGSQTLAIEEHQANKFASCFLMPARTLAAVFQDVFSMDAFVVNQDTVFKFNVGSVSEFRKRYQSLRSVSRFVARFKGGNYQAIHKLFGVSVEAMAIRLEELGLVRN